MALNRIQKSTHQIARFIFNKWKSREKKLWVKKHGIKRQTHNHHCSLGNKTFLLKRQTEIVRVSNVGLEFLVLKNFKKFTRTKMYFRQPTSAYRKAIRKFVCSILFVLGLWKPFEKPRWLQHIYSMYSVVLLTIFSIIYTAFMLINIFLMTHPSELSERFFMSLTQAALAIKVINFFVNNREWQQMLSELNDFHMESARHEQILCDNVRFFLVAMYSYFCNVQLALCGGAS